MKTLIAISQSSNKGKTSTLFELGKILGEKGFIIDERFFPLNNPTDVQDFRLVLNINNLIVGIESLGDPYSKLKERLEYLVEGFGCDIIICATREKGATVESVNYVANKFNFQTIWTSTFRIENEEKHEILNKLKAQQISEMLNILKII